MCKKTEKVVKRLDAETIAKRISNPECAKALAALLSSYYYETHEVYTMAEVEYAGVRLDQLLNEIYSCFHHVSRCLCEPDKNLDDQIYEINKARDTHLRRLILDSYKAIIAKHISEYNHVVETLKYYVVIECQSALSPENVSAAKNILSIAVQIKKKFHEAKSKEKCGHFVEAIDVFNQTIEQCFDLKDEIDKFQQNGIYMMALAKHKFDKEEKKKEKKNERQWQLTCIIIAAIFGALCGFFTDLMKEPMRPLISQAFNQIQIRFFKNPSQ